MNLRQEDKELNYCYSCEHRKHAEFNSSICNLTDAKPNFSFNCDNHKYFDKNNIIKAKLKLEYSLKNSVKGAFNFNKITNLIDPSSGEEIKNSKIEECKVFKYNPIAAKYISIALSIASMIFFISQIYDKDLGFDKKLLFFPIVSIGLIILIKLKMKSEEVIKINRFGLSFYENVFLWEFIEAIYLQNIEYASSDSVYKDYLIILMKSGREFTFDLSQVISIEKQLKKVINLYRNIYRESINT